MLAPDQTRQQAVFDRLRQGIMAGSLPAGSRLPPTRALASELGVARQTVVLAYERLAAEGYVRARTGSGTYVAPDLPDAGPCPGLDAARSPPVALSARGARLAAVPATATTREPAFRHAAGRRPAGARPVSVKAWARCTARVLKPLPAEWPAIRHRRACRYCVSRSPRIWPRRAAWSPTPAASW